MNIKQYIGHGKLEYDFETTEERDTFWDNLASNPTAGFKPQDAAEKVGDNTIRVHPDKMKMGYTFKFTA